MFVMGIWCTHCGVARLWVSLGADVNAPVSLPSARRAVHLAAEATAGETVAAGALELLLDGGADPNATDSAGVSALALVCEARRSAAGGFSWGQRREAEAKMDVLVRHGASWGDIHGLATVRGVG